MVNFCYDIIWMCDFNLVLTRCFFNEKHKKINYRKRVEYDINDKLGVKLAGDQNVPADVFPMTVNIAAYQA
ncbi:hypothetical protein CIE31_003424 [Salmonella enterica subsp. enterica serovar Braenderup]|nr:hypothetical protein [Salmonella enterica subsp. enterica serovar Braenderup]